MPSNTFAGCWFVMYTCSPQILFTGKEQTRMADGYAEELEFEGEQRSCWVGIDRSQQMEMSAHLQHF